MTLIVETPEGRAPERDYILGVMLGEYLGLSWEHRTTRRGDVRITLAQQPEGELRMPDVLFSLSDDQWLTERSMPSHPLPSWSPVEFGLSVGPAGLEIPVIYGDQSWRGSAGANQVRLPIDIFGSGFFMLTRYEEMVSKERDEHARFPASASLAHKGGFLNRPIVDEYVEVLWSAVQRLWPGLQRLRRKHRLLVSCDLDSPYVCENSSVTGTLRRMVSELLERNSLRLAVQSLSNGVRRRRGDYSRDPCMQGIDWIMEANESVGNRVAFYLIVDHPNPKLDGCYSVDDPLIRGLIRRIFERGHEIGLHGSYNSYCDGTQLAREAEILRRTLEAEGIEQEGMGGRQHYLRWDTSATAVNWEYARMAYDSTLCYAEQPGFRCGTCHEYPMFDLASRRKLRLKQRPLVVMERSVIAKRYLGLGYSDDALALMKYYKNVCQQFGGDFTLLWHNSHLSTAADRRFYRELVS